MLTYFLAIRDTGTA